MPSASQTSTPNLRYHPNAYQFVFASLRYTQENLGRGTFSNEDEESAHISGPELLHGIREFALQQFGMLTTTVFRNWGINSTDDFGHIVFELIERGEMRKTDRDQLSDFFDVYKFEDAFDDDYRIDTDGPFLN